MTEKCRKTFLKFRDCLPAGKGFIKSEGGKNDICLMIKKVLIEGAEIIGSRHQINLICRPCKVADYELLFCKALVEHGFEVAEQSGSIQKSVADIGYMFPFCDIQRQDGWCRIT